MTPLLVDVVTAVFLAPAAYRLLQRQNSARADKPQSSFRLVLADTSDVPFRHLGADDSAGSEQAHPFHAQIQRLLQHTHVESLSWFAAPPPSLQSSPWHWVDTLAGLRAAAEALRTASCIAVDVEHNVSHAYLGLSCLVQLSDGERDWVIDALAVHDDMHLLRPLFADAAVLKVLHGAGNDVLWLQRDFHIYMVNCFDTAIACEQLGYKSKSLQHLLGSICGVDTDKGFQLADWRIRPLPEGALMYARTDVHYLQHIAAVLAKRLDANGLLQQACTKSQNITLSLYAKPEERAAAVAAAAAIVRRFGQQEAAAEASGGGGSHGGSAAGGRVGTALRDCVHALCQWRDAEARRQDEGVQYILSNTAVWQLAQQRPEAPAEAVQIMTVAGAAPTTLPRAEEICTLLADAAAGRLIREPAGPQLPPVLHCKQKHQMSQQERKVQLRAKMVKKFSAQAPVYENCRMMSKDDELLCFCDRAKIDWYLARGLADRSDDGTGAPTIRLRFPHQNSDQNAGLQHYYVASRENKCVVCGDTSHYLRYRVVPSCYRRAFPVHLKSHRSHDIVLLCIDCHERAHTAAEVLKRDICEEYGVPLMPDAAAIGPAPDGAPRPHPVAVRRAAVALLHHRDDMPERRRRDVENVVRAYLGQAPGSEVDIQEGMLAGLPRKSRQRVQRRAGFTAAGDPATCAGDSVASDCAADGANGAASGEDPFGTSGHRWHGQQVVDKAMAHGGEVELLRLARRFRACFVEELQPRFLPPAWQVDHDAKRDFGAYSIYRAKPLAPSASE